MTPLVDVMLVLVVILIVTAPLLAQSIKMHLPQAPTHAMHAAQSFIAIDVDANGQIYVDALRSAITSSSRLTARAST